MKKAILWRLAFAMLAAFSFTSCGGDEPRYADPEAHEKTVQLNEQYGPLMVGTWHYENISYPADALPNSQRNLFRSTKIAYLQ